MSQKQTDINRSRYPEAYFICGDITAERGLSEVADWAVSFFALEHCIYPNLLLQRMYDSIKPGGHLGIICPNFINGMNSIRSGFRVTTRDKLKNLQLMDLLVSYYQERWVIPKTIRAIHQSHMQFPIYLKPRCLEALYYSDNDAVYLVNESKVAAFLEQLGGRILYSSKSFDNTFLTNNTSILYMICHSSL